MKKKLFKKDSSRLTKDSNKEKNEKNCNDVFYEYLKSTKPLLKPESVIIMIDSIHYKKLKPRRSKLWNTKN